MDFVRLCSAYYASSLKGKNVNFWKISAVKLSLSLGIINAAG